ncbi:hypothetical protein [Pukyongiella litopenaei]|uniref:Uncharacterized protein n=1 Tax=Pukyongiella litopenaei TaxID=2605946 RepID=A0A2S0MLK2_9RHOB|nr:hypothetical protein [Pukyongiella litopenaei]AVO36563.1 hypothetical protein C6Y53_01830 [Pukyongiella litopenaei]
MSEATTHTGGPERRTRTVRGRRVFYIPGYDPFPPRRYRELYRKEAAAQAAISGYEIALKPGIGAADGFGWRVAAQIEDMPVEAEVEVLVWSDLVRGSMSAGIAATFGMLARTAWIYISTGTLWRLMGMRKGPVIAALYPVGMLLVQLAVAVLAGWIATRAVIGAAAWFGGTHPATTVAGLAAGLAVLAALMRWFKARDNRLFAYYLMHDYAYSARLRGANPPELETRLAEFGDRIAAALASGADEVLVVGHSSGAHLAVSVLADLIRAGRVPANGPALGLLTLGQVVPMVSFLPDAHRLRADLAHLSSSDALAWVDVSAPGDGCAFALCDPVAVSGVEPAGRKWPLVFSAAFTQTLSDQRWAELRWRFFRLHFQYLCAFDRPGDYDYFRITAGPLTLGDRYAGRQPSKSRIDTAMSKYTSTSAA